MSNFVAELSPGPVVAFDWDWRLAGQGAVDTCVVRVSQVALNSLDKGWASLIGIFGASSHFLDQPFSNPSDLTVRWHPSHAPSWLSH